MTIREYLEAKLSTVSSRALHFSAVRLALTPFFISIGVFLLTGTLGGVEMNPLYYSIGAVVWGILTFFAFSTATFRFTEYADRIEEALASNAVTIKDAQNNDVTKDLKDPMTGDLRQRLKKSLLPPWHDGNVLSRYAELPTLGVIVAMVCFGFGWSGYKQLIDANVLRANAKNAAAQKTSVQEMTVEKMTVQNAAPNPAAIPPQPAKGANPQNP